ncbi:hypothetical protein Tco_0140946, partial [Tanacetum coccineum]
TQQVIARDEKWVPSAERVKISSTNLRLEITVQQKEETFQVVIDVIKNFMCFKAFTISADVPEIFMQQFWYTIKKVQGRDSYGFLLATRSALSMLKSLERFWISVQELKVKNSLRYKMMMLPSPSSLTLATKEDVAFQIDHRKKSQGKGSQGNKTINVSQETVDVSEEFEPEPEPGTSRILVVPDEPTVVSTTSNEGTGTKPVVPRGEKVSQKANVILGCRDMIKKVNTLMKKTMMRNRFDWTDDEETNDEFMHGEEHVQDDDEETDDKFVHGDEQVNNDEPSVLTPIPETPLVAPATTLQPPLCVSTTIQLCNKQQHKSYTPIITEALSITTVVPESHALTVVQLRVAKLEQDVSGLKKIDHSVEVLATLKSQVPMVVGNYLGSKLGDDLQKVLQRHIADLIQKYSVKPAPESSKTWTPTVDLDQESEKSPSEILKIKKE